MKLNRLMIEAAIVGGLLLITVLAGLQHVANSAFAINSIGLPPDTETIEQLTRAYNIGQPIDPQVTTDITGTNGTLAAVDLVLNPIFYDVNLPLIMK